MQKKNRYLNQHQFYDNVFKDLAGFRRGFKSLPLLLALHQRQEVAGHEEDGRKRRLRHRHQVLLHVLGRGWTHLVRNFRADASNWRFLSESI